MDLGSRDIDSETAETPLIVGESSAKSTEAQGGHVKTKSAGGGCCALSCTCMTICVLLTELSVRLAGVSIDENMVLYCTNKLQFSSSEAVTINNLFYGTSFFVPLVGGWIADSVAGRFNTIYGSCLLYMVGAFLLPATALNYSQLFGNGYAMDLSSKRGYFMTGIFLAAFGTGGTVSNIVTFGALQNEAAGPEAVQSFCIWVYWFTNFGSAIAVSLVGYIQQEVGFDIGYLIPALAITMATIFISLPRNYYVHKPPTGSVITWSVGIIREAMQNKKKYTGKLNNLLDYAKRKHGGNYTEREVEGLKTVGRMIPVLLCLIVFNTVNNQGSSTYFLQGEVLNLRLGAVTIPISSLHLFNSCTILIMIPVMDKIVYPFLARCGVRPTMLQRIGLGMLICCAGSSMAAILEVVRKNDIAANGGRVQVVAGVAYNASDMSIFWQVPQYVLSGCAEVLTTVTSREFAYTEAPSSMQGVVMGVNFVSVGLGGFLGSLLVTIVGAATSANPWIPNDINKGHIEYFFLVLAGLTLANFFVYLFIASKYRYKTTVEEDNEFDM